MTRVSDEMHSKMLELKEKFQGEPRTIPYYKNKAAHDALAEFADKVWQLEDELDKLQRENSRRERLSGHGRGDSMG